MSHPQVSHPQMSIRKSLIRKCLNSIRIGLIRKCLIRKCRATQISYFTDNAILSFSNLIITAYGNTTKFQPYGDR